MYVLLKSPSHTVSLYLPYGSCKVFGAIRWIKRGNDMAFPRMHVTQSILHNLL